LPKCFLGDRLPHRRDQCADAQWLAVNARRWSPEPSRDTWIGPVLVVLAVSLALVIAAFLVLPLVIAAFLVLPTLV
jgi:hypothetical protein